MAILYRPRYIDLGYDKRKIKPMTIYCDEIEMLRNIKIEPVINLQYSYDARKPVCTPDYLILFLGYKGILFRITITTSSMEYAPFSYDANHDGKAFDWRIEIEEIPEYPEKNSNINSRIYYYESYIVPFEQVYKFIVSNLLEVTDLYE